MKEVLKATVKDIAVMPSHKCAMETLMTTMRSLKTLMMIIAMRDEQGRAIRMTLGREA